MFADIAGIDGFLSILTFTPAIGALIIAIFRFAARAEDVVHTGGDPVVGLDHSHPERGVAATEEAPVAAVRRRRPRVAVGRRFGCGVPRAGGEQPVRSPGIRPA